METNSSSPDKLPAWQGPPTLRNSYDHVFEMEVESWCYGFSHFDGKVTPALFHRVIKEMAPIFEAAVLHNHIFDLHDLVDRLLKASGEVVSEKEASISVMLQLPLPYHLDEESLFVLAQIIDQAELQYGGILDLLHKRWHTPKVKTKKASRKVVKMHA